MVTNYFVVGIVGLALASLASPILGYPMFNVVAAPSRPPTIAPVVEAAPSRHPVIAAISPRATKASPASVSTTVNAAISPRATKASPASVSSTANGTTQCPTFATCPKATSFSLQQQPEWGPGEIGNVVFGIIASILGAITIGVTCFLHVRRSRRHQSATASDVSTPDNPFGDPIPLQDLPPPDLPPSYASVLGSPGGMNRDAIA